jgi:hypothetical protein
VCIAALTKRQTVHYLAYGLVGAVALWFSHPALFVFGTGGIVLLVSSIRDKKWNALLLLGCSGVVAAASFVINYTIALAPLSQTTALVDTWQRSFAPFPPTSLHDVYWYAYVFVRMFTFPVGLSRYELLLGIVSFVFGIVVLYRREKELLTVFIVTILMTLLASALRLYPFEGRLLLFMTPIVVLLVAQGIAYMQSRASSLIGIALVLILLIHPVLRAAYHVVKPRAPEELRPVLEYVDENYQNGDVLYVYYASFNAYQYYVYRQGYEHDYVVGIESRDDWKQYYHDLSMQKGNPRVWIIMSHIAMWHGVDEEKLVVSYLDMLGTQMDAFKAPGAATYLYDMSD